MHVVASEQNAIAEIACQQAGINADVARLERAPLFLLVDCAGRASRSPEASQDDGGKGGKAGGGGGRNLTRGCQGKLKHSFSRGRD